jgi:uncharacterized membrane protein
MQARATRAEPSAPVMLIVLPLAVLAASVPWDVAALVTGSARCRSVAYWTLLTGVVGAVVAAVPDFLEWRGLPQGTRARALGLAHLVLNFTVAGLFGVSLLARSTMPGGYQAADFGRIGWGWVGVMLAIVGRWLGSEFIEPSGVSAHEETPSSVETQDYDLGPGRRRIPRRSRTVPSETR